MAALNAEAMSQSLEEPDPPADPLPPSPVVRTPASSANLGPGFDVLGMALDLNVDLGVGHAPIDGGAIDGAHPASRAFLQFGGEGPLWMRCNIPMGRGLGFSGAARVGGAALAVAQRSAGSDAGIASDPIADAAGEILARTASLEGHGDNVAASLLGGIVAYVDGRAVPLRLGPVIGSVVVVAWIPDTTTPTDRSRRSLPTRVDRSDAVHNLGRAIQLVAAIEHDDPTLLIDATADRLHQADRLALVADAADAIAHGVEAGAWCGWLSGSGPTVALMSPTHCADAVVQALPPGGHAKTLSIDRVGARLIEP